MTRLIIDLETDGLLQECTKIHCAIIESVDSSYSELFLPNRLHEFLLKIQAPEVELVGHNLFNFDLKVLEKLYGWKPHKDQKIHDTYILSQVLFPDLYKDDEKDTVGSTGKVFSKKHYGSHSLQAWGMRIHCYKGDYDGGWENGNEGMYRYCIQDGKTTKILFQFLESRIPHALTEGSQAIDLEYSIAPILARQQSYGVLFDQDRANELIASLTAKMVDLRWDLVKLFKPRYISKGEFTPKRNDKSKGYWAGRVFTKIELEEFNPSSRSQIVDRLIKEWGWNPEEFTDNGNAKMDEDIIDNLPFKELAPLKEYMTIKKRLSQIEGGAQAWTKKVEKDGRIRGSIRQNGTVTGRMSHWGPNMAQIPSNESLYGKECRELFTVPKGKVMIGCDADALEMRCLAGYMNALDGGKFKKSILLGKKEEGTDAHSINMRAYGIEDRDAAKTLFYAGIYGSKNAKAGKILLDFGISHGTYVTDFEKNVEGMIKWVEEKNKKAIEQGKEPMVRSLSYWQCWVAGKHANELYGDQLPELAALKKKIHKVVKENGYIKGLDGRKLFMRSEHAELNTVLQSAGAIIMKKALYIADTDLQDKGLIPGKDYEFVLNVHDEWQLECVDNANTIDIIKEILPESIKKAGEYFNFPCEMKGNVQIGRTWAETH